MNENAFAFIVQARPCPTFGRPVHLRGSPHRLRPGTSPHALPIPPHDGHPALRRTAGDGFRSALARFQLSLSCPFRLLHTFHLLRPARHYPRVRIWRSSSERQRDFNPPKRCAAQRTLRPLLTSPLRLRFTEISPGKALYLSSRAVRLYLTRLGWILGFAAASQLTARARPRCRFVFLRS